MELRFSSLDPIVPLRAEVRGPGLTFARCHSLLVGEGERDCVCEGEGDAPENVADDDDEEDDEEEDDDDSDGDARRRGEPFGLGPSIFFGFERRSDAGRGPRVGIASSSVVNAPSEAFSLGRPMC